MDQAANEPRDQYASGEWQAGDIALLLFVALVGQAPGVAVFEFDFRYPAEAVFSNGSQRQASPVQVRKLIRAIQQALMTEIGIFPGMFLPHSGGVVGIGRAEGMAG